LLSTAGVDPADIDAVVLTHLHSDHVGWAVVDALPYFPNARYVIQQSEIFSGLDPKTRQVVLEPLQRAHRLEVIDGATRLASGVTVIHTPGHTPGHQSVLIRSQDIELVLAGDVLVHPLQLVNPSLEYSHESDPAAARETRQRLLTHAARHGTAIGTAHLTPPFVDLSSLASLHQ
jgi:glyoxylase-like metal-dependent hydrolase (beta-lactamase superfamily II)